MPNMVAKNYGFYARKGMESVRRRLREARMTREKGENG